MFFFCSAKMGILEGRFFPGVSLESSRNCRFVSDSSLVEEFFSLSLPGRVILTGILDFCSTGGRQILLLLTTSLLAKDREDIAT